MLNPREYCFWCMNKLPAPNGVCGTCGKDNAQRSNSEGELPFAILAGKYLVGHALGRGGFGITYIGLNTLLERKVAIKEYFPSEIAERAPDGIYVQPVSQEAAERFAEGRQKALEEATIMARVQNVSNVVTIYDCFGRNNTVYIIMEFIEGESFSELVGRKGPQKWKDIWPQVRPAGIALAQLHQLGLIHRDISPDNLMLRRDTGEAVLLDFGAASGIVAEGQEHVTALKDGYAPLEQYQNRAGINGRADEYSWCATLWYILTGTRPPNALQRKAQQCDPKVPRKVHGKIPESVRRVLLRGMAIQQQDRYSSMESLIRRLDTWESTAGSGWKIVLIISAVVLAIAVFAIVAGLLL